MDSGVRQMGSQEVDIVAMVSPVTKYAATVLEPSEIRYHMERAWHEATSGRMGPVWIDIPLDVQATLVDEPMLPGFSAVAGHVNEAVLGQPVAEIIKLLNDAERPVILAGSGVKLAGAEELLCRFAETNQIPILLTWKAVDFLDHDHPLNFGSPGIMGCRAANFIVQNSDLLLVMGSRLDPSVTAFDAARFGRNATRVMVDIDEAEIRKVGHVDVPVIADAGDFLRALNWRQPDALARDRSAWLTYCRRLKERYPVVLDECRQGDDAIDLYVFIDMLFRQLVHDDVITPESSGAAGEITYQAMRVKKGQKIKNAAGLGAMGFGLPYAIGACIANDRRRTILINGDGAFQLNIQELETVVRLKLPVKMFILDNNGYGSIMATQRNLFDGRYVGSSPESGLTLPDLCAIANAYGIRCEEATSHLDLADAIVRTLEGDEPAFCRVRVSRSQVNAPRVQAMKTPEGGMISKPLEDMWPYLPPEEVTENMIAERQFPDFSRKEGGP
jgi:acetolactate synthase-1/2/3 large subunit